MKGVNSNVSDAVVGCISGLRFEQISPWVGSLDACGFRGRRIVIHVRADSETVAELDRRGYETYDASCLHSAGNWRLRENPSMPRSRSTGFIISGISSLKPQSLFILATCWQ